jgi:hypothetical protein
VLRAGDRRVLDDRNKGAADLAPYREVYDIVKRAIFADPPYRFDEEYFETPRGPTCCSTSSQ